MEDKGKSISPVLSVEEEMEVVKNRIREVEEEADLISEKLLQAEEEIISQAEKEEIDSRSIYVGNVEYECTAVEVHEHFQGCGIINRVTILTDEFGTSKGYAFVEFAETQSVQNALVLNGSELRDRQIKVSLKRTNIPAIAMIRRRFPRGPFTPVPLFNPIYGKYPKYNPNNRYGPY